ncbi:OmpH family outer membrane protein [Aureispira sp. CCB-E]|uniref:OmpH family outer membrane protein n=1 Tax=Aureispira sp. CCB-E TaxID=3051121 RepID=UPI0028692152|nr:OmpH family outer membrane protein [Aureispira sp. CCB-E]WMX17577.1 OmpH family outer membrane protein [Aureispira sp. CCB-E]
MKQTIGLVFSIGISIFIGAFVYTMIPQTAFVDNRQIFEAFEGKKELEQRLEQMSNKNQGILDSLGLKIQGIEKQIEIDNLGKERLHQLQQEYQYLSQLHQKEYQEKSQEYTEAIWKQISEYTREYGQSKGYDYVFGIAGQGTLMYGKDHYNITKEVIIYINLKYAGN